MGRPVMLSNNSMVVGLNEQGLVHDFYYPYVGQENLTTARSVHHKIGVWVDGVFSWLEGKDWTIDLDFEQMSLISRIKAKNDALGIQISFVDFVDHQYNAFCRKLEVVNLSNTEKDVRLFFHQVFQISSEGRADTALFVPRGSYIFDYKGHCALLVYACDDRQQPFDQFAVGNYAIEGKAGTYMDAEDGELSGNLVEHGGVDSVIRCRLTLPASEHATVKYWVIADSSQTDAEKIHKILLNGFDDRLESTKQHWQQWLALAEQNSNVSEKYKPIFYKSLLVVKAHIDKHGGLIASCDSSIYNYGRDYYTYVWPRDGALTMLPLIELGYSDEPKRFFEFCADTMHPSGYMMHKYQPDRAIGSTWHPLMHQNYPELAIQEDETASVVFAIGRYLEVSEDQQFEAKIYHRLVKPACEFMARFIDDATNLPHASYDLWEESFGTHTYTVLLVYQALKKGVAMAERAQEAEFAEKWNQAMLRIKGGLSLLINPENGYFRRSLKLDRDGNLDFDETVDSSTTYAMLMFGQDLVSAEQLEISFERLVKTIYNAVPAGGVLRYEHDNYFLADQKYLGNPWFICTLWLAQYLNSTSRQDLAEKLIEWTISHASPSGTLSEQVGASNSRPVGVSPLVWSHAELVYTLNGFKV